MASASRREKDRLYKQKWRRDNPDKQKVILRRNRLKRVFGLTEEEYQKMLEGQKGVCALCGKSDWRNLAVDHCHTTGKVRALLCGPCNNHLGVYERNADRFRAYLDKFGASK